jgi:hypothetical protein
MSQPTSFVIPIPFTLNTRRRYDIPQRPVRLHYFLFKPCSSDVIAAMIEQFLESRRKVAAV